MLESKGGGGLQSAPPDGTVGDQDDELHLDSEYFDKDDQESHDHQLEDQDPYVSFIKPQFKFIVRLDNIRAILKNCF